MKLPFLISLGLLAASATLWAAEKPLLVQSPLSSLAAPSFTEPLAPPFLTVKGKWIPQQGVLGIVNIPAEKHIPVLHHKIGLATAVIEVEFRFDGPGSFLVGCDADKHVGRVVVNASGFSIAEDSVKPSHTIAKHAMPVKPGEWHRLRVEWQGDQMAARLDGKELLAQHQFLATAKSRSWLAGTETVKVRNLKISGEPAAAKR
jgi:hypothetical protein